MKTGTKWGSLSSLHTVRWMIVPSRRRWPGVDGGKPDERRRVALATRVAPPTALPSSTTALNPFSSTSVAGDRSTAEGTPVTVRPSIGRREPAHCRQMPQFRANSVQYDGVPIYRMNAVVRVAGPHANCVQLLVYPRSNFGRSSADSFHE